MQRILAIDMGKNKSGFCHTTRVRAGTNVASLPPAHRIFMICW